MRAERSKRRIEGQYTHLTEARQSSAGQRFEAFGAARPPFSGPRTGVGKRVGNRIRRDCSPLLPKAPFPRIAGVEVCACAANQGSLRAPQGGATPTT